MKFLLILANIQTKNLLIKTSPQMVSLVKLQRTKNTPSQEAEAKPPVQKLSGGRAGRALPGILSIRARRGRTGLCGRV